MAVEIEVEDKITISNGQVRQGNPHPPVHLKFKRLRKTPETLTAGECEEILRRPEVTNAIHELATVTTSGEPNPLGGDQGETHLKLLLERATGTAHFADSNLLRRLVYDLAAAGIVPQTTLPKRGKLPTRARASDAGIDFYSDEYVVIPGRSFRVIKTGVAWAAPEGWGICLRDRSSMGGKGIHHFAGVIDCEYRDEWYICLANFTDHPYAIQPGDKICQGILVMVPPVIIEEEEGDLPDSDRGKRGYGSSGK